MMSDCGRYYLVPASILSGAFGLLQAYLHLNIGFLYYATYILFFVFAVLYGRAIRKAVTKYW